MLVDLMKDFGDQFLGEEEDGAAGLSLALESLPNQLVLDEGVLGIEG